MENIPETTNTYESQESKIELISTLYEHYNENIRPKLEKYLQVSSITFKEEGLYNEDMQRAELLAINSELSKIKGTMSSLLKENESLIPSIGDIYSKLIRISGLLAEAPDARFSRANLIEKFNGKENIPAGRADYEQTRESLIELKAMFRGLNIAINLLK